jgi:hypothetical protein
MPGERSVSVSFFVSYLPDVGQGVLILGFVIMGYWLLLSTPWMIAAMRATCSKKKGRRKAARKALKAMRRSGPPWWPGRPKDES